MEVGRVKSENDEYAEVAIARQRALIAEHAKRLYLVQVNFHCLFSLSIITKHQISYIDSCQKIM